MTSNSIIGGRAMRTGWFAIVLPCVSATCAHQAAPVETGAKHSQGNLPTAEEVLAQIRAKSNARKNIRALTRATYFGDQGRVRLSVVVLAERDASFRFETLSPLEQPLETMVSDGQRLWLLSEGVLKEGPATPENIARLLPLPLRPEEVVEILLGGPPVSARFSPSTLEQHDDAWQLKLRAVNDAQALMIVSPKTLDVTSLSFFGARGERQLHVAFDDFEEVVGGGRFPRSIRVEMPSKSLDLSIKFKSVDVNVALDTALFRLRAPPGIRVEAMPSPPVAVSPP